MTIRCGIEGAVEDTVREWRSERGVAKMTEKECDVR